MGDDLLMPDEVKRAEGENLELRMSHAGRVYHPAVCRESGRFLAENRAGHDLPDAAWPHPSMRALSRNNVHFDRTAMLVDSSAENLVDLIVRRAMINERG
jgi:hypothetical protein